MGQGIRYIFNEKYFLFIRLEFIENSHESHESHSLTCEVKATWTWHWTENCVVFIAVDVSGHSPWSPCIIPGPGVTQTLSRVTCHDMSQHALHHPQHGHRDNWHINHLSLISSSLKLWETRKLIEKVIGNILCSFAICGHFMDKRQFNVLLQILQISFLNKIIINILE